MKIKALIFFIAALLAGQKISAQILKGSAPLVFEQKAHMDAYTPGESYDSELAFVLADTTLYRWSRAADAWAKLTTTEVYQLATAADTTSIAPHEGDVAYVDNTLIFFRGQFGWLQFSGGGQADGLTILGDGTGGDPFRVDTALMVTTTTLGDTAAAIRGDFPAPDGNGIYSGSGTIGSAAVATIASGSTFDIQNASGSVETIHSDNATTKLIRSRLYDNAFERQSRLELQAAANGSSSAYAGIVAENDNTLDYSSFEAYEAEAETNSTGLIRLAGDSVQVQNYARTSGYALPVTTPSTTLNDTTIMAWRGTGAAATPLGFIPKPSGGGAADGNGLISALPAGDVTIDASSNFLKITTLDSLMLETGGATSVGLKIDHDAKRIQIGDYIGGLGGITADIDDTNGWVRIGDVEDVSFGTKLIVDDVDTDITLNADNGTVLSGSGYSYVMPTSSPSTTLNDTTMMAWRGTGAAATPLFIPKPGGGGGSGTVTSVGLTLPSQFSVTGSPVTTSGTLAGAWQNQAANTVLAGPSSGGAAAPTFRSLVAADVPLDVGGVLVASSRTIGASVNDWVSIGSFSSGAGNMALGISITSVIGGGEITKTYRVESNFIGAAVWYELSPITSVKRTSHDVVIDLNSVGVSHSLRFRKKAGAGSGTIYFRIVDLAGNAPTFTPSTSTGSGGSATVWNPTTTINSFTSYSGANNVSDFGVGIGTQASTTYELNVAGAVNTTGGYYVAGELVYPLVHSVTLGNTATDYVDFFNILTGGSISLMLEISSQTSGHNLAKTYILNRTFVPSSTDWYELLPVNAIGQSGNDIAYVAIQETGGTQISLRAVRRTGSGSTISLNIKIYVLSTFSSYNLTSSTGSGHTSAGIYANSPLTQNNGKVGIGISSPAYAFDINGTGGVRITSGTTAQRPTGANGVIRHNDTENLYEGYSNSAWKLFPYMDASKAQLIANNWKFDVDASVAGLGGYKLEYNSGADEIKMVPSAVSTRGTLNETVSTAFTPNAGSWKRIASLTSAALSGYSATDSTLTYSGSTTHWARVEYSGSVKLAPSGAGTYQLRFTMFDNTTELAATESKVQVVADAAETWIIPISGHYITQVISGHVFSLKTRGDASANPEINNLHISVTAL